MEAEIAAIRRPRWVADIITVTLTGEQPAELRMTWRTDARARARLEARLFGKRILFTNRDGPVPDSRPPTAPNPTPSSGSGTQGPARGLVQPHAPLD